jgi:hypothetical protein
MTKYVYSNGELPHLFAADKTAYAANSRRSIRVESGKIYSYAEPIGAWFGDKVLLSSDSFSVTTSKHQTRLHYAVNHIETISLPRLKSILGNISGDIYEGARYIAARVKEIDALKESAKRLRADWKKAENARQIAALESACAFVWNEWCKQKSPWQSAIAENDKAKLKAAKERYTKARGELESGLEYAARKIADCRESMLIDSRQGRNNGLQSFWRLDSCVSDIRRIDIMGASRGLTVDSNATFNHAAKIMGKKWAKECTALAVAIHAYADSFMPEVAALRADYDKAESVRHAENIAAWLAGDDVTYPHNLPVACRVAGDSVETSKGARVPLQGALQLVALAKQCRESGKALDLAGRAIGPYKGNSISATGDLTIGCHRITWEAIADCVARYEVTPCD